MCHQTCQSVLVSFIVFVCFKIYKLLRLLWHYVHNILTLEMPETKIAKFSNSVDPYEATHDEQPHLDLHCLSFCF